MDVTAVLAADLAVLTAALYDPDAVVVAPDLAATVLLLAADARLAVPPFLGLTVTVTVAGHEDGAAERVALRFTVLDHPTDPDDIGTSLRLPGAAAQSGLGAPSIEVVLYAATPGAFVDMAADLSFLAGPELGEAELDRHRSLAHESDITGVVQTQATTDEAIGVLIAGGRTREQASTELDSLAGAARTSRTTEAARIMATLNHQRPDIATLGAPPADPT